MEIPAGVGKEAFDAAVKLSSDKVQPLRDITPNSGAYWNEASRLEPNWEEAFWGLANYQRLKEIKKKYDPNGMFRVWQGVGGTRPETCSDEL